MGRWGESEDTVGRESKEISSMGAENKHFSAVFNACATTGEAGVSGASEGR